MTDATRTSLLEQARESIDRGEWENAYTLLVEADRATALSRPDVALLARVAYAAGHLDATIDAWERAHAEGMRAGDHLFAAGAAVRVAMHLLFDTALMAPVRSWIRQAERLLEGQPVAPPIHAWLAVVHNYERMLSGDFPAAREWARKAIATGSGHDSAADAVAVARVAEARSLILEGEVRAGLRLLDEAGVAIVSGELDSLATGIVYCEIVCGLQALAQYDLAEQWTEAMERWRHGRPVGSVHGRCRVHRAEILRLRGSYVAAENEALLACEELRPYLRRELGWPLTELGRIRLRRGASESAKSAFLAAHEAGWDPQPGLALVHLAQGDRSLAASSIRSALEQPLNIPSKEWPPNTELRRAPLLEAQVEIEIEAGDLDQARAAAEELARIAAKFESRALIGSAALARGRVKLAEGEAAGARQDFEEALRCWSEVGAPYEAALARMGIGHTYQAEGRPNEAMLELEAAQGSFERIGSTQEASRAAESARVPLRGMSRTPPEMIVPMRDEAIFRPEGEYWTITFERQTFRLRELKGLRYLARLLAEPGREIHVLDLVAAERSQPVSEARVRDAGLSIGRTMDAGPLLDARAKEAYRRRLAEIEEDIDEARGMGDPERAARSTAERDFVVRELVRAVGLGGRDRLAGSASERARASVTRAVRQVMSRIREHSPSMGAHLERTIRTGTYCAYLPDPRVPIAWKL